jgi:hypothetical protein
MLPPIKLPPTSTHARYGYRYCDVCGFEIHYCACKPPPPQSTALDGAASTALEQRIREVKR